MQYTYSFSYLPCQSCHAKVNCQTCADNILTGLKQYDSIAAQIDIAKKEIILDTTLDADTAEEYLEDLGVFV